MAELKNCPFCGSDKVDFMPDEEQPDFEEMEEETGFIYCHECGFSSDSYFKKDAYEHWNRREPGVVRCEECKYHIYDSEYNKYWCNRALGTFEIRKDDFCSYGEREGTDR